MNPRSLVAVIFVLFTLAPVVFAPLVAVASATNNTTLLNPLNLGNSNCSATNTCLNVFLMDILQVVVSIGSIVVMLMLIYVGFKFVVARGDPNKISEARTALLWTVVGALVLLGAEAIAQGIQATVSALATGG